MSVLGRKIFLHGACIRYAEIIFYFYSSAAVLSRRVTINEVAELLHSEEETFMAMSKAPYKTDVTLLNVSCYARLHTLLHVVACF